MNPRHLAYLVAAGYAAVCLFMCSCAQTPARVPSMQPIKASISGAEKHVQKAQESSARVQTSLDKAKAAAAALAKECAQKSANWQAYYDEMNRQISDAWAANQTTKDELGKTRDKLGATQTQLGITEEKLKGVQKQIDQAAITEEKYHRLKYWVCSIASGITALLIGLVVAKFWKQLLLMGWAGLAIAGGGVIGIPTVVFIVLMTKL